MHKIFINKQVDGILAICLLVVLLAAVYGVFKQVYLEQLVDISSDIEIRKKKNAKIDAILASEKDLRAKIRQQKNIIEKNKIFLTNAKAATAASELQNYIKGLIATRSGAKILTIKPYPVVKYDNYSEASLEIRISGMGHESLQELLYGIESHSPVLIIQELDIKLPQRRYSAMVEPTGEPENLGVTFVVSGFFREA